MAFQDLKDITEREIVPGYRAKFVHSENMTLAYWDVDPGAALPRTQPPPRADRQRAGRPI